MSVYNGERWLNEMIRSIEKQDYTNWQLVVRNDGSTDRTEQILSSWANKLVGKMRVLNGPNLGMCESFSKTLRGDVS